MATHSVHGYTLGDANAIFGFSFLGFLVYLFIEDELIYLISNPKQCRLWITGYPFL